MTEPNLHLVPGADEPKCLPTVPIVTLADVLGDSFATQSLNSRALILAIAAHSEAEIVFEFGLRGGRHGLDICEHMGDGTIAIMHDTSPSAERRPMQGRDIAPTLTPEAVAKTAVLTHVDWLHGKHARLEYAPWLGACDLVLVDASQAYDYVKCDSLTALHLTKPLIMVMFLRQG